MKKRRLPAAFLIGALLMGLLMPLASAAPAESETGYVFRLKETAVMPLAALEGTLPVKPEDKVVFVLSGGNVDPALAVQVLSQDQA